MTSDLERSLKRVGLVILALTTFGALVAGARLLFAESGSPWRQVVPAVATVVLVLVTGVYAWLTYRLVQQSDPRLRIQAELEERAMADVARMIQTDRFRIDMICDEYPLKVKDGSPPNTSLLIELVDKVVPLRDGIRARVLDLPGDLQDDAEAVVSALTVGERRVFALASICGMEAAAAQQQNRIWTVQGASTIDYTVVSRGDHREGWGALISGAPWEAASKLAGALHHRIQRRRASGQSVAQPRDDE
jgi:hypothetical protein